MVESYSKNANHNMRRPVVKEEIVDLMRQRQKQVTGSLKELEDFARKENIPIIPHETVAYFRFLMETMQPKNILEIGTAIGFSALLMAEHAPNAKITTIDRNPEMIGFAKDNFAQFDSRKQITLLEGDAVDVLSTLTESYDFVFMDSAKSKYIVFLPRILELLEVGGVVVLDDIFQGGTILEDVMERPRRVRKIHRRLNMFLDLVQSDPTLKSTLLPLGDGIIMIQKMEEKDFKYILEEL